jgi:hypothetical protein
MHDKSITHTPEQELMEMVLKYRDALNKSEYLPVTERETDRQRLNTIYVGLSTIRQKILDSKCYYELGKLQKELSDKFLAEESSPTQRLYMLSYLVRSLCHPLVFIATRSTITTSYHAYDDEETKPSVSPIEAGVPEESRRQTSQFRSHPITAAEIKAMQSEVRQLFRACHDVQKLRLTLSLPQAQILSQLAASGDIKLTVTNSQVPRNNLVTSVIVKESDNNDRQREKA